jgi:signal transduction histidine kinase
MEPPRITADPLPQLSELEADFQRALDREKLEAMAEFAAGAGHEINNPLTVISGRAQLLLREETDPERQRALTLIVAQAMRVYEMIADMMLFARPPRPEFRPVDLAALVDEVIAAFEPRCRRQDTTIGRVGPADPVPIEADPVQIQVALRAICQNALESLQSGGHVEIAVDMQSNAGGSPGVARVTLRDDGPGIKPEERRHLFDPFYSARQAGRGLGLGLSKAWRIVSQHGGRIDVASEPGHGATFVIELPVSQGGKPQSGEIG